MLACYNWFAVIQGGMGTVQGGKPPHKRPSENTASEESRSPATAIKVRLARELSFKTEILSIQT